MPNILPDSSQMQPYNLPNIPELLGKATKVEFPSEDTSSNSGESSGSTSDNASNTSGGQSGGNENSTGSDTAERTSVGFGNGTAHTRSELVIDEQLLTETIGPIRAAAMLGSNEEARKRQHHLDYTKYLTEFKKMNPNCIPNNQDAYPVDQKIEELEVHHPNVKLYVVDTPNEGVPATVAAMQAADAAEKRIVKLENMMATLQRIIFRMGARMSINCVYYGGQTPFEKYKAIRCLCDDRVDEGQDVQIDQCLYCTRFEPVLGQCYELLNDTGANVASILDDNQMGYQKIDDFVRDARIERFHDEKDAAEINVTEAGVKTRDPLEYTFLDIWGPGLAMDWTYVPKEEQKCHINWRQSIRDDGSSLGRLASWPYSYDRPNMTATGGQSSGGSASKEQATMENNKKAMDSYNRGDIDVQNAIGAGQHLKDNSSDDIQNKFAAEFQEKAKKAAEGCPGGDWLMLAGIAYARNKGADDLASIGKEYKDMASAIGSSNPALIIAGMGTSAECIIGGGSCERLDKVVRIQPSTDTKENNQKNNWPDLNWDNRESWLWADFSERFLINAAKAGKSDVSLFPVVCYAYCSMSSLLKASSLDGDWIFPFTEEQLKDPGIWLTALFHEVRSNGRLHNGVDLATGGQAHIPFRAIADGTVMDAGQVWDPDNAVICVQHTDGSFARYMHASQFLCKTGDQIKAGQEIGVVGNVGPWSTGEHLHLEIGHGDPMTDMKADTDPMTLFPKITGGDGDQLQPAS